MASNRNLLESLLPLRKPGHLLPSVPIAVPYGAQVVESGVQFTLFSRHATRVWLMLFDEPDATRPTEEYELVPGRNRIGDIWHIHVKDARPGQYYLYRMEGRTPPGVKNFYNPRQWLLDPYALAVAGAPAWGDAWGLRAGERALNGAAFPKGIIVRDEFDWSQDRTLNIPLQDTIIYETHLRGYTVHPSSGVAHPGTYKGFIEKIPYLQKLGITAVEFLPVQEFNEMEYFQENMHRRNLLNYWGYSTQAFFAPNGRYATSVYGQQVREFKELVVALHRAGIEIIMDVVFNHTTEGGDGGPTYSFRGIDNSTYYLMTENGEHYTNYTGCGNTVNSNHPVVRNFIMDCLRYWTLHMHVDGFRFDLASVLARGRNGELLPNPPIVEQIAEDPALRDTKIIAEAWDAAGAYQVGSFPSDRWSEWNGRFRDDVRRFWAGERGLLGGFATRICGSADLYDKDGQTPLKSINFVTCHDGFTLNDLVSYERKHNDANGEGNRDGENNNHARNYGVEGPATDERVLAMRRRQQKNLLASVFLAQGVPMLLAGDEFGRTQKGNNNAYCQDNEISWVDWSLLKKNRDLYEFARQLVQFRKTHAVLRRLRFFTGRKGEEQLSDIQWFGPNGKKPDWEAGLAVACLIDGRRGNTHLPKDEDSLFLVFNADEAPMVFLVPLAPGRPWNIDLTTQEHKPAWSKGQAFMQVEARSVNILVSGKTRS
jgi:isoamylase